jgi:peptide/nickel transport system substrate-binding protein
MSMARSSTSRVTSRVTLLGAGCLMLLPTACTAGGDDDTSSLIVAVDQTIEELNPLTSFFALNFEVNNLMYTPLIQWSPEDYSPQPGLATEWSSSQDQLTWTYKIRDDAQWSDGEPITANDAAFTYQLMMDDDDLHAANAGLVDNFDSVEAVDDTTLVIKVKERTSQMTALNNSIVPSHVWKDIDSPGEFDNMDFPAVSSGPFQVSDFKVDEYVKFSANKNYYAGAPKYDELVFQYYKTPDAAVQALHSGDVDLVGGLNPAQFESLKGEDGIAVNDAQNRRLTSVTFNVGAKAKNGDKIGQGHPALRDAAVRQAMHAAVDKAELIDKVEDGLAEPGVSYIPPIYGDFFWDPGDDTVQFDIDEANAILDDAGYQRGDDGIRSMPDGDRPLEFRLLYHSDEPSYATIAEFLAGWWEELGISIELESADSTKLNDQLYAGDYDVIFSGWGVGPDPTDILALYTCDALPRTADSDERTTDTFYCNDKYDTLFDKQKAETDAATRADLINEMQQLLYTDAPAITLYYAHSLEAYRSDRWGGFQTQPADGGMIRLQQGMWGYYSAEPLDSADQKFPVVPVVIAVVVVLAAAAAGVWWLRRRHTTVADRE